MTNDSHPPSAGPNPEPAFFERVQRVLRPDDPRKPNRPDMLVPRCYRAQAPRRFISRSLDHRTRKAMAAETAASFQTVASWPSWTC